MKKLCFQTVCAWWQSESGMCVAALGIWIGNGSRFEPAEYNGISHFIEHMIFKGTENRTAQQIAAAMDAMGG